MQQITLIDVHTSRRDIARIVGPTLLTDTVGFILIRFAVGMGTAAYILAGLLARHPGWTAHIASLTVAAIRARRVQALGMGATGFGMRATLIDVHTARSDGLESVQAEALILNTFRIVGAIEIGATQDIDIGGFASILGIWFSLVALRTLAAVAWHGILTDRVLSAWFIHGGAFIDIDTTAERIARIVGFACANETTDRIRTDGIITTRIILALVDVYAEGETDARAEGLCRGRGTQRNACLYCVVGLQQGRRGNWRCWRGGRGCN